MLTENTITKLREMRLGTMADAFKEQLTVPNIAELSFENRFGLLVYKELLTELAIARTTGTFNKAIERYKKPSLLILDEWLLYQLKESEARDLLEITEARYKKGSIIFCSQFDVPGWHDKIGSPIIADAICDRIVHDSYRIVIECEESMRKIFGVNQDEDV